MLFNRFSPSIRCVCIMSVVVLWYVQSSSSRALQSDMQSSSLIIVMAPPLSASFIEKSLLEERSLRAVSSFA